MLRALVGGARLSASELAHVAGVSASTASSHLRQLLDGGMVVVERAGRHRLYELAGVDVANALEALHLIAPTMKVTSLRQYRLASRLRQARQCYDHLAGVLGVRLTYALVRKGVLDPLPPHGPGACDLTKAPPALARRHRLRAPGGAAAHHFGAPAPSPDPPPAVCGRVSHAQLRAAAPSDPVVFRAHWKVMGMHGSRPSTAQPTREQLAAAFAV
jgi:DNA-binding transcriptional ArsR family regulator